MLKSFGKLGGFFIIFFFLLFISPVGVFATEIGTVNTFAGSGAGFSGDGGLAIQAKLRFPGFLATSLNGDIYIGDNSNNRIRKVDSNGIISTVAGNGVHGFSGDGGPAVLASIAIDDEYGGISFDHEGNLYIADSWNNRIRKVDINGIITTVVGIGVAGWSGDGGLATAARISDPADVVFDNAGNMYFSDRNNSWRIRKVDTNGIISTVAGVGQAANWGDGGPAISAALNEETGLATDRYGNLYVADTHNNQVRKIDPNGIITRVAGKYLSQPGYGGDGGLAVDATLNYPTGVSFDQAGNMYIAEYGGNRIRKVDTNGLITTFTGTGVSGFTGDGGLATSAQISFPVGVRVSNGYLYFADTSNHRIRTVFLGLNSPPIANAGVDLITNEGQNIALDGSASSDPDGIGDIVSYNWDFGDGSTGSGITANHAYLDNGDYTATLTVTDTANYTSTDTAIITVNNIAPVVGTLFPINSVLPGTSVSTNANFTDPGILDTHIATFDWGDGVVTRGSITESNGSGGITGSHIYVLPGAYTITLTVMDKDGGTGSNSINVTILTPAQAIQNLTDLVQTYNFQQGIENSLDSKLQNAIDSLNAENAGNRQDAINKLQAFISAVQAQSGNKITVDQANILIQDAQNIIGAI